MKHLDNGQQVTQAELNQTLQDLQERAMELQQQIHAFENKEADTAFNSLEYYQENLENVKVLISIINIYINRRKSI